RPAHAALGLGLALEHRAALGADRDGIEAVMDFGDRLDRAVVAILHLALAGPGARQLLLRLLVLHVQGGGGTGEQHGDADEDPLCRLLHDAVPRGCPFRGNPPAYGWAHESNWARQPVVSVTAGPPHAIPQSAARRRV